MSQQNKTIYLVDGNSYIYRAYHAIGYLSNSKGLRTNAIFGFTKMLLKLFDDKNPEYAAVALDSKGPTFRHEIYDQYKATRPPMPDDLIEQLPYIKSIIQWLGVKMIEMPGYEADDIIGTLAKKGEEKGYNVVVVTGDKDFRQIISDKTSLWDTMKDKVTDLDALHMEYGLEPAQIIDLMGLSGDTSDNVPGVKGVGEKTALTLIQDFGSLEKVYEHLEEITKKKLKENLENSHENALLSKRLVAIDCEVPLNCDASDLKINEPDSKGLSDLFRELEFKGLWEQFVSRKTETKKEYTLCISEDDLAVLVKRIQEKRLVSIDTETTGTDPHKAELVGISFSLEPDSGYYLPIGHMYLGAPRQIEKGRALEILRGVLEDEKVLKVGQNIKYDAIIFKHNGIDLKGIYFDTMVASYVINPGLRQHNLDYLAQHYLNHRMISYNDVVGRGKAEINFSGVTVENAMEYSCEDADITLKLKSILEKQLIEDKNQDLFHNLEMKLLPVLMDMELAGIKIDVPFFREMSGTFGKRIRELEKRIFEEAGTDFNLNSPQQLGYILFEKLELPVQKKTVKTKSSSTDVKVLTSLAREGYKIPGLILEYRTLAKLKSTYLDALVKIVNTRTGRIHSSFNQTVAATGRLSSSNPNLQNIPIRGEDGREIRKGFIAEEGRCLLSADYSQVELRLFAHYSGDSALIEAFQKGQDIHSRTASEILGVAMEDVTSDMRRIAKAINFGIIYGMGAKKLADELNIDNKTAREYIDSYYDRYRGVVRYREAMTEQARELGYVTTLFNRRRYLPEINSDNNRIKADAERIAVNTPIQGTAADLIKMAMINIHAKLKSGGYKTLMLLQVHDELVFEAPEDEIEIMLPLIKKEMEEVYRLDVPLKVDAGYGRNWDEAH
ncbi:MAG: DNA polymerase I [Deltaproteobacteria bacterium]|nr:DNA polymerase I [Deltaproteobacteria bacterium]